MKFALKKDGPKDLKVTCSFLREKLNVFYKRQIICTLEGLEEMEKGEQIILPTGDELLVQMRGSNYLYIKLNGKILPGSIFDPNYLEDRRKPKRILISALMLLQILVAVLMFFNIVPTKFSKAVIQQLIILPLVPFLGFFYFWCIKKGGSLLPVLLALIMDSYYIFMFDADIGLVFGDFNLSRLYLDLLPAIVIWSMSSYWTIDTPPRSLYDKE